MKFYAKEGLWPPGHPWLPLPLIKSFMLPSIWEFKICTMGSELPLPQLRTHRTFLRDERRRDCEKYKNFKDGAEEFKIKSLQSNHLCDWGVSKLPKNKVILIKYIMNKKNYKIRITIKKIFFWSEEENRRWKIFERVDSSVIVYVYVSFCLLINLDLEKYVDTHLWPSFHHICQSYFLSLAGGKFHEIEVSKN